MEKKIPGFVDSCIDDKLRIFQESNGSFAFDCGCKIEINYYGNNS